MNTRLPRNRPKLDVMAQSEVASSPALAGDRSMRVRDIVAILIATGVLASAALYNGYPLTFWDTRAYLESAATLMPRPDRLIGYAFLLRVSSWAGSLWPGASPSSIRPISHHPPRLADAPGASG